MVFSRKIFRRMQKIVDMKIAIVNLINATITIPPGLLGLFKIPKKKLFETDAECSVVKLAKTLAEKGHKVIMYSSDCYKPKESISGKIKNLTIKYLSTKLQNIFPPALIPFCPSLYNRLKRDDFDIIQCTDFFQWGTIFAVLAVKKNKIPVIVWQDLNNMPRFPGNVIFWLYHHTLGIYIKQRVTKFLGKTKKAIEFLLRYNRIVKDKIGEIVFSGVDTDIFRPLRISKEEIKKKIGINPDYRMIFSVGRLHPDKGFEYLIYTMKEVVKKYPDAFLYIQGEGQDYKRLNNLVNQMGLKGNISISQNFSFHRELSKLYNISELFVLPSIRNETIGFVIQEAMACGRPVISTNMTGPSDLICDGKDGFLVPAKDPKSIAQKILFLLKNPSSREKMGKEALEKSQQYSWQKTADKFIKIYEEILRKK